MVEEEKFTSFLKKESIDESSQPTKSSLEAGGKNSCKDEIIAMRLFDADSTASYRLTKIAYLKLYNRLAIRKAVDLLFQAYAEKGLVQRRKPQISTQVVA